MQLKADAAIIRADLESCEVRFGIVQQASKLVIANLDDNEKHLAGLAKAAEEA